MQGAGGTGGLLMSVESGTTYVAMYDGLGNIHGMINAANGNLDAAYEYDAFGKTLRATGTYAANNAFGFSTKYTDAESGLVYYGHRFYSPSLGRFVNRDPIAEQGGLNLYGFAGNDAINDVDYFGMWPTPYHLQALTWAFSQLFIISPGYLSDTIRKANHSVDNMFGQLNFNSYKHFMRMPGETQISALQRVEAYGWILIDRASAAISNHDDKLLGETLGYLSHLFGDGTTDEHVDQKTGELKVWNWFNIFSVILHIKGESKISESDMAYLKAASLFSLEAGLGMLDDLDRNRYLIVQFFEKINRPELAKLIQARFDAAIAINKWTSESKDHIDKTAYADFFGQLAYSESARYDNRQWQLETLVRFALLRALSHFIYTGDGSIADGDVYAYNHMIEETAAMAIKSAVMSKNKL
jgi:RHS repeat-associated protein